MKKSLMAIGVCLLVVTPAAVGQSVVVDGAVESTAAGFKFPDGTVQGTAMQDTNAVTLCGADSFLDGSGSCVDLQGSIDALLAEVFARLVFVTSETFDGTDVGSGMGAAGGDAHCQRLANAAGHQGRYLAWLSDSSSSPASRFTQSQYRYRLIDGTVIAEDFDDLIDGELLAPLVLDEYGVIQDGISDGPWTGTSIAGDASDDHCLDWLGSGSGLTGLAGSTTSTWTESLLKVCGQSHRLYCFQQ
jgi:hypothetical protein